jgi:hypothetical protein
VVDAWIHALLGTEVLASPGLGQKVWSLGGCVCQGCTSLQVQCAFDN